MRIMKYRAISKGRGYIIFVTTLTRDGVLEDMALATRRLEAI